MLEISLRDRFRNDEIRRLRREEPWGRLMSSSGCLSADVMIMIMNMFSILTNIKKTAFIVINEIAG